MAKHTITKIVQENHEVKTFFVEPSINIEPGQFVMVWLPEIDEKPFTISYTGKETAFTAQLKGPFTKELFKLKKGDHIWIRGPYGNHFGKQSKACVIAGGIGLASLAPLIEQLNNPTLIFGFRSKNLMIFNNRFKNAIITTDDGSFGIKGFATAEFEKLFGEKKFDVVYTCGPEIMMKKVFDICEKYKIRCYASLERYMKCGIGICASCVCNGQLVCKDGPVFASEQLRKMNDFGNFTFLKTGRKVSLKDYK